MKKIRLLPECYVIWDLLNTDLTGVHDDVNEILNGIYA